MTSELERLTTGDLAYHEIRDALWLANRINEDTTFSSAEPAIPDTAADKGAGAEPPPATTETPSASTTESVEQWTRGQETAVFSDVAGSAATSHTTTGWPVRPAMAERRGISKALRPLSRFAPSPWTREIDEVATATRAAQDHLWIPVWKGAPTRRFDVALVVDHSFMVEIWQDMAAEFRALLAQQGAFRDVRTYFVDSTGQDLSTLPLRSEGGASHDWGFLLEPTGNRIVLVLTDTIGKAWHNGAVGRILHGWAQRMPVAIVHTLAQRLWSWGGIVTNRAQLWSPAPGVPNRQLRVVGRHRSDLVPVPVLGMSAEWMSGWARLIAAPGAQQLETTATMVSALPPPLPPDLGEDGDDNLTARERVLQFRTYASVDGFHLAGLLAATPLSPSLMNLVQRVLFPQSDLSALAEVLLGGLIRRRPDAGPATDAVTFEFPEGVREELLGTLQRTDTAHIARVLDEQAGDRIPALRILRATLDDPSHDAEPDLAPENRPYLEVQAAVLRALSGPYARHAKKLRAALVHENIDISHSEARTAGVEQGPTGTETRVVPGADHVTISVQSTPEERRPATQPQIWGAVPLRNPDFVGRIELLEQLRRRLAEPGTTAVLPEALHGMGGVGKSQTVVEYIHRHAGEYDVVWWIPAEQQAQIRASLVELAKRLGVATAGSAETAVPAALEALRLYDPDRRWLLVFDNADNPQDVTTFFPAGTGHIIVTSRNSDWRRVARPVEVDLFTRAESIELLMRRGGEMDDIEADALAEALGDLPLAVEQAAAWRASTGMPVAEYLELLEQNRAELLAAGASDDDQVPMVAAVWNVPLERLRESHPDALQLLQVCAFFGPDPIPQKLFRGGRNAPVPKELRTALRDPIKLGRAVRQISQYSLAKLDHRNNTIQLHRLVQTVLRNSLSAEEQEERRHAVHVLLANGAPDGPDLTRNWRQFAELLPHAHMSFAVDCEDEWVRDLVTNLVDYLLNSGDIGGARDLAAQAVKVWSETLGESDSETLEMSQRLAVSMRRLGEIDNAIRLNEQTRRKMVEALGENHESMLEMLDIIAADRRQEGRFREELELQQTVYARSRDLLGVDDPTTMRYAHNLAGCLRQMGRFGEALVLDTDNLQRRTTVLGLDNPYTLGSRVALCVDLRETGHYLRAVQDQQDVLDYQREVLNPNHPRVIGATRNLAVALSRAGDHARALELTEDCLTRYKRRHGDNHIDTITALMNFSTELRHNGNMDDAVTHAQQSYERFRALRGDRHPYTLVAALNLAIIHRLRGDVDRALDIDRDTHAVLLEIFDADHPSALVAATNLASDLAALGHLDQARSMDEATLERSRRMLGQEHPSTLALAINLAIDLDSLGESTAAATLHRATLISFQRTLGQEHLAVLAAMSYARMNCDTDTMQL
ncbi:FxSxx-COOH system tetratricopeptide repeat protein [Lentzea californiensis]|uniref:FxSxx-COOH system tetratricopeptide repeat protein n=1 Tax=Lentzea californiensis TaxID=438851 RepID=UPI002165FB33|nr:FxSxx-COOH system tetratricopeptide repeat protein [Lentzea californiensis]MCR3754172.1 Tetratricopeptide repeat-containing protein [Lentzea californiensis]